MDVKGKKLLILGANPETTSLVLKAKEMGVYTIVTDYNPNAYAKPFADQSFDVDASDVEAIVSLAKQLSVDGVAVGVAEALLPFYCEICNRLNMPSYSTMDVFKMMVDKAAFKSECRRYGVPVIDEYSRDEITDDCLPVIVKPTDSCSSRGITVCASIDAVDQAIEVAKENSRTNGYLIERYVTGDEVISYYVLQDGIPTFVGMCDRYVYKQAEGVVQLPTCYVFPSIHTSDHIRTADEALRRFMIESGLRNGSIFFQGFAGSDGIVRTYEPGFRLNGAQEHLLVSRYSGIDAKELYVNYALTGRVFDGNLADLANPIPNCYGFKLSPLVRCGKIGHIKGLNEIRRMSGVVSVNPSYSDGDVVEGLGTLKQIVCRFFAIADTPKELEELARKILNEFSVVDESGENMLIDCFDPAVITERY